tara:strand:- start:62 stop:859 length:798 start_codon:yes stop_codon:yes gene_type:complete
MAITNATRVADFGSGIGTQGAVLQVDNTNNRIGIGTTNPNQMLQVGTAVSVYGNSGIVSATSFYGDGTNLTGTGATDFINSTQLRVIGVTTAVGGVEFGAAGVGGTIDGVGNAILSGITTIGTGLSFADNIEAKFGNSGDLRIYHDPSNAYVAQSGVGDLYIQANTIGLRNGAGSGTFFRGQTGGAAELYFNNSKKLETHNTGVKVTGIATISSDLNVAGITTVGILTAYESITVKVGAGSTELTTALSAKASTGKAIAMAMVFG